MRFGVSVPGAPSSEEWKAYAKRAENSGFDTFLVPDHLRHGMWSPLTALVAAAEATSTIRLGTLVLNNDLRHPVLLGREAATVDVLTGGRLEIGLGAGYDAAEYTEGGLHLDAPAVRVGRMAEAAQILRGLWSGDEVWFKGKHYQVEGHRCFPTPPRASIPLLIGGNGRKVLETAAQHADIVGFIGISQDPAGMVQPTNFSRTALVEQIGHFERAAGPRSSQVERSILIQQVAITEDRQAAAQEVRSWFPGTTAEEVLDSPFVLIGSRDRIADDLRRLRQELGITYVTVLASSFQMTADVMEVL